VNLYCKDKTKKTVMLRPRAQTPGQNFCLVLGHLASAWPRSC